MIDKIELSDRTWVSSLPLEFVSCSGVLNPRLEPSFRDEKHGHSIHYDRSVIFFLDNSVKLSLFATDAHSIFACIIHEIGTFFTKGKNLFDLFGEPVDIFNLFFP